MASRLVLLLLLLSLFSTFIFAKPSWKLVEVEDEGGDDPDIGHEQKLDSSSHRLYFNKDNEQAPDGSDYQWGSNGGSFAWEG